MATPKKTRPTFLHLHHDARELLRIESRRASEKQKRFVSRSKVADRIFSVLRKRPKLLKEVLKNAS